MRRATNIQAELVQIRTIEDLTEVFESIASMHIANIRNRVIASKDFFAQLWPTYRALRIDAKERVDLAPKAARGRNAYVAVTAEGKLGGAVDEQIIGAMLAANTQADKTDIMVIGSRGASHLKHMSVPVAKEFAMPASDIKFNVGEVISILNQYDHISVFYQTYESLRVQQVVRIELLTAVRELGQDIEEGEIVTSKDYIFEPDIQEIAHYMESVMMGVALIQIIMESKLAQYANRFNAMNRAKHRAGELVGDYRRLYYRAKRAEGDERLKEMMKLIKAHQRAAKGVL